jgi:hypothetical protein
MLIESMLGKLQLVPSNVEKSGHWFSVGGKSFNFLEEAKVIKDNEMTKTRNMAPSIFF